MSIPICFLRIPETISVTNPIAIPITIIHKNLVIRSILFLSKYYCFWSDKKISTTLSDVQSIFKASIKKADEVLLRASVVLLKMCWFC